MENFKAQACRACGKLGHRIKECRAREEMFREGKFLYFPRDWRAKASKGGEGH